MIFSLNQAIVRFKNRTAIVPPSGFTAQLTLLSSAAMAFLAVFALALSLAADRLAQRWGDELSQSSTLRISAPVEQIDAQTRQALRVLETTPGVETANLLDDESIKQLLEPWLGPELPIHDLPLPAIIEITEAGAGYDGEALRLRLAGEVPGAVLDDHTRWRRPLVESAQHLRLMGSLSLILIGTVVAGIITLAAHAALAANERVIKTLRLVGAKDRYIARAFVRRFTLRGLWGGFVGSLAGMISISFLPPLSEVGGFLTGLGFVGAQWALPFLIPCLIAVVAYVTTQIAARRVLRSFM